MRQAAEAEGHSPARMEAVGLTERAYGISRFEEETEAIITPRAFLTLVNDRIRVAA
ncbi:hypothetical protein [Streptomyces sp. NPDC001135]